MKKKAILVTYPESFTLSEAFGLAEAAEYEVVKIFTQKYLQRAKFGVGSGKAEEIRQAGQEVEAEAIIFDERMKTVQVYNLAKLTGVEVIDREKLILEIFAKRATTAEAKLQVQLAELRYGIAGAREKVRLAKKGEQPGFFGLGKYEVDVYYTAFKRRIATLTEKLRQASRTRELHRLQRRKAGVPTISLAGYTGVGKTTLFNLLAEEHKEVDQGAFTTLTTAMRAIALGGQRVLLSDTVGFISRLPTYMIEAFKSTLEELTYADLVLLIVDVSEPLESLQRKYNSCVSILSELQVSPSKVMLVFNKSDLAPQEEIPRKSAILGATSDASAVCSAKTGWGIEVLKTKMHKAILEYSLARLTIPPSEIAANTRRIDWLRERAEVKIEKQPDGTLVASVRGPAWIMDRLQSKTEEEPESEEN